MNTKLIKQKMKGVGNIKKITRTMEMVSVAKMKKATQVAHAYRPYISNAMDILARIPIRNTAHEAQASGSILIIMAANKGLCGGYNTQVYKSVSKYFKNINASSREGVTVIAIGKYAEKIAKRFTKNILYSFPKNNVSGIDARVMTREIMNRYQDKENPTSTVTIIYPHVTTGVSYAVESRQLLPYSTTQYDRDDLSTNLKRAQMMDSNVTFEPSSEEVVRATLPLIIEATILAASLETIAGEHAARMMAMKTASDNAGDLLGELKLTYNNARQAKITQEIAEISSAMA